MKYKVLSETFDVSNEGAEPTHYVQGDIIELDAERAATAIESGWVEGVAEEGDPKANAGGADGALVPPAENTTGSSNAPAPESAKPEVGAAEDIIPPVADGEPRLRYRGQVVLSESERTVGRQTFKHIRIVDGSEYDLTNEEYANEVKLSMPPAKK
jgi:hypothetical protein